MRVHKQLLGKLAATCEFLPLIMQKINKFEKQIDKLKNTIN